MSIENKKKGQTKMGISVYMALEAKNKNGEWEKINFSVPNYDGKTGVADFSYPNGCHNIFEKLGYEKGGYCDEAAGVQYGMPEDASEDVKAEYLEWSDENYEPDVRVMNIADLHVDVLENPKMRDYDASWDDDGEAPMTDNPLKDVYDKARAWISVWTSNLFDDWIESNYRIIGWGVC